MRRATGLATAGSGQSAVGSRMKVLWVDPLNTNPQFLNLMSVILREAGCEVQVCSIARAGHPPPADVQWSPFVGYRNPPATLKGDAFTAGRALAAYPLGWLRGIRRARAAGVKAMLVTSNLTLCRPDTWAMRALARLGVAPVVIVHKPYQSVFEAPAGPGAARYRAFYRSAARILTMNAYTRQLMQRLYQLPEERYGQFPHPHFQPLLDRFAVNQELSRRLQQWAGGAPVIAFLSNMRPEQGLDDLLSGLAMLNGEHADWRLLLVSTGGSDSRVRAVAGRLAELGLGERCWPQWDAYPPGDLKAYLEAASLVATPYRWATQSGVAAMAAGAGRPVVATAVGGLPEMIRPGVNGELVPAGNPARLAGAISAVISGLEGYQRGARACRDVLYSPQQAAAVVTAALRAAAAGAA